MTFEEWWKEFEYGDDTDRRCAAVVWNAAQEAMRERAAEIVDRRVHQRDADDISTEIRAIPIE